MAEIYINDVRLSDTRDFLLVQTYADAGMRARYVTRSPTGIPAVGSMVKLEVKWASDPKGWRYLWAMLRGKLPRVDRYSMVVEQANSNGEVVLIDPNVYYLDKRALDG